MNISIAQVGLAEKPARKAFDWDAYNLAFQPVDISSFELLENIARGHSFAPVFNGKKNQDNFASACHIAIDFDDGKHNLATLLADPFVLAYASILYPSLSHTPDHPRYRVVFILDAPITTAVGYDAALQVVKNLYPASDPSCYEVSRGFFGNGRIHRDNLWEQCYYNDITLPLADLRVIARQQQAQRRKLEASRPRPAAPVYHNHDLGEVMRKLQEVDPYALSYDEWVATGCALAREYGDAALFGFKQWSDRPGKEPLSVHTWNSFKQGHSRPAGLGTVIAMIHKYGRAA